MTEVDISRWQKPSSYTFNLSWGRPNSDEKALGTEVGN